MQMSPAFKRRRLGNKERSVLLWIISIGAAPGFEGAGIRMPGRGLGLCTRVAFTSSASVPQNPARWRVSGCLAERLSFKRAVCQRRQRG